jgi:pimeloyl-ACP methyl ester carboxylesterase
VLAYLATRADVNQERIAVHGFSAGGATALMAAARFPQIAAVVSQGGYHDFAAQIDANTPYGFLLGDLFRFGVRLGYRLTTGDDLAVLSPISVIGQIAPRPVLLIYGTHEPGLDGARQMQAAGGSNVALWEVPGAGHGGYVSAAPEEYAQHLIGFLDAALAVEPRSPR